MSKKAFVRIITVVLCMMFICLILSNISNANSVIDQFKPADDDLTGTGAGQTIIKSVLSEALNIARIVAAAASIIGITVLGIKYMIASPSEKANVKQQLITFLIGAVLVVGAVSIITIVKRFAEGI